MNRPCILLDIDGVAASFIDGALPFARKLTGLEHKHDDIDQMMMEKALGLTDEQTEALYKHISSEGWCRSIPVYPGAKDGISRLREIADVHPVTFQFPSFYWVREREAWLHEHFGIDPNDVIHTNSKHRIAGDIFVEDKTSNLVKWKKFHPQGHGVLFRRRYNQNDPWDGGVVSDWPGLVQHIETVLDR